jgi:beta-phosphoglucomutase
MKAIILDMDGVLVDSMVDHAEAWKQALATVGISIERKDIYELEGSNHGQIVELMFRRFGLIPTEDDIQKLSRKKVEIFDRIEQVRPFEGMKELLLSLRSRYKLAVVSGSDGKTVRSFMKLFFAGIFQVIVDGDEVKKSKPSPEPYQRALEKLGVAKEHCIVIENSPLGIRSAKSAGLRCLAIPTYLDRKYLKEADVIVENHRELGKYIQQEEEREEKAETGHKSVHKGIFYQ